MLRGPLVSGREQGIEAAGALFGFHGVPVSKEDEVVVPPGYTAEVLFAWGDPVSDGPALKADGNTAAEQAQQAGMHHDGLYFFPLPLGSQNSARGCSLSIMNTPMMGCCMLVWSPGQEKVAKSQAAHGVSVIEIAHGGALDGRISLPVCAPYHRPNAHALHGTRGRTCPAQDDRRSGWHRGPGDAE